MAKQRAAIKNGKASDFDAPYLDDWAASGEEVVDILIDDVPADYIGPIAWDPATQRIYPDPRVAIRAKLEALSKKAQLEWLKSSGVSLTSDESKDLDVMIVEATPKEVVP